MRWALLVLAACGSKASEPAQAPTAAPAPVTTAPECDAVVDHLFALQLATSDVDPKSDAEVAGFKFARKHVLEQQRSDCTSSPWSPAFRLCIANIAPDHDAAATQRKLDACRRDSLAQKHVDLGGPACETIVSHLVTLGVPSTQVTAEVRANMLEQCSMMPRTTKECALRATDEAALAACDR